MGYSRGGGGSASSDDDFRCNPRDIPPVVVLRKGCTAGAVGRAERHTGGPFRAHQLCAGLTRPPAKPVLHIEKSSSQGASRLQRLGPLRQAAKVVKQRRPPPVGRALEGRSASQNQETEEVVTPPATPVAQTCGDGRELRRAD